VGLAVVTGGGRGIGAATARSLARDGFDLVLTYRADAAAAEAVAGECRARGHRARVVQADTSVDEDIRRLFAGLDQAPAALVNNAGIVAPTARVDQIDGDRVRRLMAVNVVGPFLCAGEAVRRMSTAHGGEGGVIVNVSSAAARLGSPGEYVDYAASKAAIDTLTIGLAKEVAAEGIRVNAVRPGIVDTEIHASGGQPDRPQRMASSIPLGRPGQAIEIADAIAWLCSDQASYVTGALLDISGGR
jgi:NAD(P)-dependent dehydrogenase (short-subunit alcohol dehydrogenase family)